MPGLRFSTMQSKPIEILDFTSLTIDEFQILVAPFEAAFQNYMREWRLDGKPIRTIEQARSFLEEVGFCLTYPKRPALLVPTFIGAFVGAENRLPGWQQARRSSRPKGNRPWARAAPGPRGCPSAAG